MNVWFECSPKVEIVNIGMNKQEQVFLGPISTEIETIQIDIHELTYIILTTFLWTPLWLFSPLYALYYFLHWN